MRGDFFLSGEGIFSGKIFFLQSDKPVEETFLLAFLRNELILAEVHVRILNAIYFRMYEGDQPALIYRARRIRRTG